MDITKLSNTLLEIFYIMIGLYMATTMVFTLKDKMKIDHFITLLEEVGNDCSLIVNSEVGCNISKQPAIGPHFGDIIQIIEFKDEADLKAYPTSKEHQRLLKEGPEMKTVTAIDYYI